MPEMEIGTEMAMRRVAEQRILTLEVLLTDKRIKEREYSIEKLKNQETMEKTDESEAQAAILEYVLHLGGVREDVYKLLLKPLHWKNISKASAIRPLLYHAAPPEWLELAVKMQEKEENFYLNELILAYKDGIPIEVVKKFIEYSQTLFELCQCRLQYLQYRKEEEERNYCRIASAKDSEITILNNVVIDLKNEFRFLTGRQNISYQRPELSDMMSQSQKEEPNDTLSQSEEKELNDTMSQSEEKELNDTMSQSGEEERNDTMSQSGEEERNHTMSQSEEERNDTLLQNEDKKPSDILSQSEEKEPSDILSQSKGKTNDKEMLQDVPVFPKGEEVTETKLLVTNLEEKEKSAGVRISFFTELLKMHQKKMFAKLEENAQVGKLFEIMIGKKYGKRKILSIKKLMDGGMSKEFIYSLIEKDLPEEELEELSITLMPKQPEHSKTEEESEKATHSEEPELPNYDEEEDEEERYDV